MSKMDITLFVLAALAVSTTGQPFPDDPFVFETERLPENLRYMPTVGNGHLATVINTDTIYVNGLYNSRGGWSHRARIPAIHASNLSVFPAPTYRTHTLDTKNGVYKEVIQLETYYTLTYAVYAHQYYNRLLVTDIKIERTGNPLEDIFITRNSLTGNLESVDVDFVEPERYVGASACVVDIECFNGFGTIREPETELSGFTEVYAYWRDLPELVTLAAGEDSARWTMLLSIDNDQAVAEDNFQTGLEVLQLEGGADILLAAHTNQWSEVWNNGYIHLEGDNLELQRAVYGSFYYLYSSLPSAVTHSPNNQFFGLSAGGLANGANATDYQGHVSGDMETYMYPPILMFRPDLARQMLSYRVHGMDAAFIRAASEGFAGTRFPRESAFTGEEVTPDTCPLCGENQLHITGDIALAVRQYLSATRDTDWLETPQTPEINPYTGLDFVYNMALFLYSRPSWNNDKTKYEMNGVMTPDEFAVNVNNSLFTNTGAMMAINIARYAACLIDKDDDVNYRIPDRWLNVARSLEFSFDPTRRYHPEYEGYEYTLFPNGTVGRGLVKQADIVLLNFPLLLNMPDDVKRNDLEIYEKLTAPNAPPMTWNMFSIGWLEFNLQNSESNAQRLFNKSYQLYRREPFQIWTEAQSGQGATNFITGMGGFLQNVLFGYGGIRLQTEDIKAWKPRLPQGITAMTFKNLDYLGSQLDIHMNKTSIAFTVTREGLNPLFVKPSTNAIRLIEGEKTVIPVGAYRLYTDTPSGCALPEDYIKVDYSRTTPPPPTPPPNAGNSVTFSYTCLLVLTLLFTLA